MSASTPRSRNCSATTNRKSVLVITIGLPNNSGSEMRPSTCWNVDPSPTRETNCFGMLSRETGHSRVPAPPHMITGTIFVAMNVLGYLTVQRSVRQTSSSFDIDRYARLKPPDLDIRGLRGRIERALHVHHQPATV